MADPGVIQTLLDDLRARNEAALELAVLLSAAVRIEQPLVRRLRLRFLPAGDPSAEADLWFSLLVRARSTLGITLRPDVLAPLRGMLAARMDRDEVRATIAIAHAALPPLLALEERLVWLGIVGADDAAIHGELAQIIKAMVSSPSRAEDLSAWCVRALPQLPLAVRRSAGAWVLRNAAQSLVQAAIPLDCDPPLTLADATIPSLLPNRDSDVVVAVQRTKDDLVIDTARSASGFPIRVPGTQPLFVVVDHDGSRDLVAIPRGERRSITVKASSVVLRCLRGNHWRLAPRRVSVDTTVDRTGGRIHGRALLVGSQLGGMRGVDRDVGRMATMLERRGFAVDVRTADQATRAGILAGYDELIANVRSDEAAVFYYSGGGFRGFEEGESRSWQGICPIDLEASTAADFRGITAWELSIKETQLTWKTRNVTVILDCCHASQMSRGGTVRAYHSPVVHDAVPRVLAHPVRSGFAAHLRWLRERYEDAYTAVDPIGNPDVVRLVACGPTQSAFEYLGADGAYRGVFTDALIDVLDEVGLAPVSWAAIGAAIRARVLRMFPVQRPDVEGPARRQVFSLEHGDASDAVAISATGLGFRLGAGHLLGVTPGDIYGVMPPGPPSYRAENAIAEIRVSATFPTFADAELIGWRNGHSELPRNAIAVLAEKIAIRRPVRIDVPTSARGAVEAAIHERRTLRLADPDEATALPTLRLTGDMLTLEDEVGSLLPGARFPDHLAGIVNHLANLGVAQGLRELEGEHGVRANEIAIGWGAVDRGQMRPMSERGGSLALRDRLYVKITNVVRRPLYVHLFNIGLRGKITLLTTFASAGVMLTASEPEFVLGQRFDGELSGLSITWPDGMPREAPRIDEIVVIVTSAPANLHGLETVDHLVRSREVSKLQALLTQLQDGNTRDVRSLQTLDGFFVKRLCYFLDPRDAAMTDIPFEIDDNPLRQVAARDVWIAPRDGSATTSRLSGEIAIRIRDLAVGNSRVVSADFRIDVLVCTRTTDKTGGYATWTERYHGVTDGQRLHDDQIVYYGSVHDFVDIYFWITRDTGSLELAQLLSQQATRPEFDGAVAALLIGTDSPGATRITALGSSAILSRMAYEALGEPTGVYRTSFLADEQFGAGRHPSEGLYRAEAIAFWLTIELVEIPDR